jgi:hypothetical protein
LTIFDQKLIAATLNTFFQAIALLVYACFTSISVITLNNFTINLYWKRFRSLLNISSRAREIVAELTPGEEFYVEPTLALKITKLTRVKQ